MVAEARERIERSAEPGGEALIVEADPGWHRGVLGIAASRLAREYQRPVLLFGVEGEKTSGSGRSIPGVPLHDLMSRLRHHLGEFGGHSQAVGASLPTAGYSAFREEARALFRSAVPAEALDRREEAEAELALDDVDETLAGELSSLEPHGAGNPRPTFLARGVRAPNPWTPVSDRGLRGRLARGRGDLRCVAWSADEALSDLTASGGPFDIHYRISDGRDWGLQAEVLAARRCA